MKTSKEILKEYLLLLHPTLRLTEVQEYCVIKAMEEYAYQFKRASDESNRKYSADSDYDN